MHIIILNDKIKENIMSDINVRLGTIKSLTVYETRKQIVDEFHCRRVAMLYEFLHEVDKNL